MCKNVVEECQHEKRLQSQEGSLVHKRVDCVLGLMSRVEAGRIAHKWLVLASRPGRCLSVHSMQQSVFEVVLTSTTVSVPASDAMCVADRCMA